MSYTRYLRYQLPTIAAIGRTALGALRSSVTAKKAGPIHDLATLAPGPVFRALLPAPDEALTSDFVTHLGGHPAHYAGQLPPHFFPQWTFPLLAKTLESLPIPAHKLLNGGFRLDVAGPLPLGEALEVEARITAIEEDARKIRITQEIVTGTASSPRALTIAFFPVVPKGGGKKANKDSSENPARDNADRDERLRPTVPETGVELFGAWDLPVRAGLDFAMLTGDFNPIHWVAPAARMSGFRNVILHGFASFGRVFEQFVTERLAGDASRITSVSARFNKPLVLPAKATAWIDEQNSVWLGAAQGEKSWLSAHFTCKD